jgi:hypothetical protein
MPRLVFEGTVGLYCSLSPPPSTSLFSFPVFSLMPQLIYVCPLIFFLLLHFSDCFPLCLSSFRFSAFFISCHCIYSSSSEPSFFTTFIYVCLFPATGALFFFFFSSHLFGYRTRGLLIVLFFSSLHFVLLSLLFWTRGTSSRSQPLISLYVHTQKK